MTARRGEGRDARWVLFDLDDTLFDYAAAERAAVRATLDDAGLAVTDELLADYRVINARHWRALERGETTPARLRVQRWEEVLATHGGEVAAAGEVARRYLHHLSRGTMLLDGAAEVVARLARTHRIAFISNGLADVQRPRLAASALATAAEVVVISDEVGAAKPDPAIFDAAFARMGGPDRDAVVFVGDSPTADLAGGLGYGLATVWLAAPEVPDPEGLVPTHRIADLRELPPLLGGGCPPPRR